VLCRRALALWQSDPSAAYASIGRLAGESDAHRLADAASLAARLTAEYQLRRADIRAATRSVARALRLARRARRPDLIAEATVSGGRIRMAVGRYDEAEAAYRSSSAAARDAGAAGAEFLASAGMTELMLLRGLPGEALEFSGRCAKLGRELGDYFQSQAFLLLGAAHVANGTWVKATAGLYRALAISERFGFLDLKAETRSRLGTLLLLRGRAEESASLQAQAVEWASRSGNARLHVLALCDLGQAYLRLGQHPSASLVCSRARRLGERLPDPHTLAAILRLQAELAIEDGMMPEAARLLDRAIDMLADTGLAPDLGRALSLRARLFALTGDPSRARADLQQAVEVLCELPDGYELAQARMRYAQLLAAEGERRPAARLLAAAGRTFRRLSLVAEWTAASQALVGLRQPSGREAALLESIKGMQAAVPDAGVLLSNLLRLIVDALGFEHGLISIGNRTVCAAGNPDMARSAELRRRHRTATDRLSACFRVRLPNRPPGFVYLERSAELGPPLNRLLAGRLAACLAGPLSRAASTRPRPPRIRGLAYEGLIGRHPAMIENLNTVVKVASAPIAVLIHGESGTGKELLARALHESGARSRAPFVPINCAAIPETLLEAELFGIAGGTATGVAARKGKIELADGGTVFLDEIGDMSQLIQAKLLRVVQDNVVEPVGSRNQVRVDIRIVAATNKDLDEMMRRGDFREDLYYRLNAVEIRLPSLRERIADLPALVRHFVAECNREAGRSIVGVAPDALRLMLSYSWPGNVRQLRQAVWRAVLLAEGPLITIADLPDEVAGRATEAAEARPVRPRRPAVVRELPDLLRSCLADNDWNVSRAARDAGYSRVHFYRLMKKHSIHRPK
jgi:DNA-binding NtrC family response regulator